MQKITKHEKSKHINPYSKKIFRKFCIDSEILFIMLDYYLIIFYCLLVKLWTSGSSSNAFSDSNSLNFLTETKTLRSIVDEKLL